MRVRFFDADKLLRYPVESRTGVEPPPKVTNTHRSENHQASIVLDIFATSKRFGKKRVMITPCCF